MLTRYIAVNMDYLLTGKSYTELNDLIRKALKPAPEERFKNAKEFRETLKHIMGRVPDRQMRSDPN